MTVLGIAIVRDEIDWIDSLLTAPVDGWLIVDTGSVDGTVERLRNDMRIELFEREWVNFGHNRSEALQLGVGASDGDWLLALDADMTVEWDEGWVPDPAVDAYMLPVREKNNPGFVWRMPLLLRGDLPWVSVGAVHEYTALADGTLGHREPTDAVRITYEDRSSPAKTARYASMLEEEQSEHPDDPRTTFYLAQTYREMGDSRAMSMYRRRIDMGGWDQETYYAMYRYALLLPTWPTQLTALIAAWEFRPTRLEALHAAVSELNRQRQHRAAYALSVPAVPTDDSLFVHGDVWAWGMAFERSIAAWWVGERGESRMIGRGLLERDLPASIRAAVERNLEF